MSDNVTFIDDDDADRTVFQTEEDLKEIEHDILGQDDDDTTEVEATHRVTRPGRPYWQQTFG